MLRCGYITSLEILRDITSGWVNILGIKREFDDLIVIANALAVV
jgi:hypothetical protein